MNMILKISYSEMQKLIFGGHGTPYGRASTLLFDTLGASIWYIRKERGWRGGMIDAYICVVGEGGGLNRYFVRIHNDILGPILLP